MYQNVFKCDTEINLKEGWSKEISIYIINAAEVFCA